MHFDNISVYWWRKQEHLEKTIDLPQVTDKLYHMSGNQTQNFNNDDHGLDCHLIA